MRNLFDQTTDAYFKSCSPFKHTAVNEVTAVSKGRVTFKQYSPLKHKYFDINIYKLCDMKGCTQDMRIYLGKDRQNTTQMMIAKHVTEV